MSYLRILILFVYFFTFSVVLILFTLNQEILYCYIFYQICILPNHSNIFFYYNVNTISSRVPIKKEFLIKIILLLNNRLNRKLKKDPIEEWSFIQSYSLSFS